MSETMEKALAKIAGYSAPKRLQGKAFHTLREIARVALAAKGSPMGIGVPLEAYRDELLKIAADLGEPDDPFAAWESVGAMKEELRQWRAEESERLEAIRGAISAAPVQGAFVNINQPNASEPVMQQWRCVEQYGPRTGWEDICNAQFADWKAYADKTEGVSIEYRNLYAAKNAEDLRIRPLKWKAEGRPAFWWLSDRYRIERLPEGTFILSATVPRGMSKTLGTLASLKEAMAVAQADHAAHIIAAIEPKQTAPGGAA